MRALLIRGFIIAPLVAAGSISLGLACTGTPTPRADPSSACAEDALRSEHFVEAAHAAEVALERLRDDAASQSVEYAGCLRQLGIAERSIGRLVEAEGTLHRALEIFEESGTEQALQTAAVHDELGLLHLSLGELPRAMVFFEAARAAKQKLLGPRHPALAPTLDGLGLVLQARGRYDDAASRYQEALELRRLETAQRELGEATSLHHLGVLQTETGDLGAAHRSLAESLGILEGLDRPLPASLAAVLDSMGVLMIHLGQYDEAIPLLARALPLQEESLGREALPVFVTLNSLADAYFRTGDMGQGRRLRQRIESDFDDLSPNQVAWRFSGSLAEPPITPTGPWRKVLRRAKAALSASEDTLGPYHSSVGFALVEIARLLELNGEFEEAGACYERALLIAHANETPRLRALTLRYFAEFLHDRGDLETAILFGKQAVDQIQTVRAAVIELPGEAQQSLLRTNRAVYEDVGNWLIEAGRVPEALEIIELLKGEELSRFLRRGSQARRAASRTDVELTPTETRASRAYATLRRQVAALGREYDDLLALERIARHGGAELDASQEARVAELRQALAAARKEFRAALDAIQSDLRGSRRAQALESKKLESLRTLQSSLARMGSGCVLVHYLMTEKQLHIIVTTPATQLVRSVAVSSTELNATAYRAQEVIRDIRRNPRPASSKLYQLVMAPIRGDLEQAGAETVMLALDGALRYVPWSALFDPERKRYLVEDFTLALYTEGSRHLLERARVAAPHVAALGVDEAIGEYRGLPAVRAELESIVKRDPSDGDGLFDGVIFLNEEFHSEAFVGVLAGSYPLVHVASHFVFNPGTDRDSFLLLGDGSHLSLADIRDQNLSFDDVDLITLSACETAVGENGDGDGAEVEGFGALVQGQGAAAVVATLWMVNDESTSLLMRGFYEGLARGKPSTKADALRRAQLAFLTGRLGGAAGPSLPDTYKHPYYWAAFILMGNWL